MNRFRIYFRPTPWTIMNGRAVLENRPCRIVLPIGVPTGETLIREFTRNFAVLFNGGMEGILSEDISNVVWSRVKGQKFWKGNSALVVTHEFTNKRGGKCMTLGFEMDMRPFRALFLRALKINLELDNLPTDWIDENMPSHPSGGFREEFTNFHVDWVGINCVDPSLGFSVQTLMRHRRDWASMRSLDIIHNAWLPEWVKKKMQESEESLLEDFFNKFHFLAGRRSWVIARADDERAGRYVNNTEGVYFLETAAIERYALALHEEILSKDPGVLVEFRKAIKSVWITLLMNYVKNKGFEVVPFDNDTSWEQEEEVDYKELIYPNQPSLESDTFAQAIMKLHPMLEEQLSSK